MPGTWIDIARETMTEAEVHDLLVGMEEEVALDREAALDRAHDDVANHFKHVVILAWNDGVELAVVGDASDQAVEMLQRARRNDRMLEPLRAHLTTPFTDPDATAA